MAGETHNPGDKKYVYKAELPEYKGYGLIAIANTEDQAEEAVKNEFKRTTDGGFESWEAAKEWFGFYVGKMLLGKCYWEGSDIEPKNEV